MIVKVKPLKINILQSKNPFKDMKYILNNERNKFSNKSLTKSVIFCRYIGIKSNESDYINELKELDESLQSIEANYIKFTNGFEKTLDIDEVQKMKAIMDKYIDLENANHINPYKLFNLYMGYQIKNECLEWTKKQAFKEIIDLYDTNNTDKNKTIRRNFGIKLLLWMDKYLKQLFEDNCNINIINKVMFYGNIKRHELYFLILLSKLGCDVIYINPKEDIDYVIPEVKYYSNVIRCSKMHNTVIQFPVDIDKSKIKRISKVENVSKEKNIHKNFEKNINIDMSNLKTQVEKSCEEIAKLAESVVMINVYDDKEQLIGKGSGIVISDNGFIITNFHVVNKGVLFGVVFENDNNEYLVYNIIKYHTDYDLALIKVDQKTKPIKLSKKDLMRGQKIIAIGSPLGLFNTISEGIVSGFRKFDYIEMVQITAPISPGSSGGALIDMYGRLVGITTAGFEGQNLNMAVPAQYIKQFVGNITKD
ncbi:trypsin-like peptidase domain-containing protein [Clostridium aestuarii]|uniref:Trypsin-like peptidase domain-containing protein n=1 Tax=Clostridium aestuarii TaxID=338193 RepID=A0ABT4D3F6_9CLOT|nr:YceG family protein [Clostridium aestuarii]MCY6485779.1 trypsin-like peptidase domain-containing protein [Clostridium aestuarii]